MLKTPAVIPSDDCLQPVVIRLDLCKTPVQTANFLRPLQSVDSGDLGLYFTN
jgi:hypothetical protein